MLTSRDTAASSPSAHLPDLNISRNWESRPPIPSFSKDTSRCLNSWEVMMLGSEGDDGGVGSCATIIMDTQAGMYYTSDELESIREILPSAASNAHGADPKPSAPPLLAHNLDAAPLSCFKHAAGGQGQHGPRHSLLLPPWHHYGQRADSQQVVEALELKGKLLTRCEDL